LHPESNENPNPKPRKAFTLQHCGLDQPPKFKFKSGTGARKGGDDLEVDQGLRDIDSSFIREHVKLHLSIRMMLMTILAMTTLDNWCCCVLALANTVELLDRRTTMMKDAVASLGQTGLGAMDLWSPVVCRERRLRPARPFPTRWWMGPLPGIATAEDY
jgi:hypothetical protein